MWVSRTLTCTAALLVRYPDLQRKRAQTFGSDTCLAYQILGVNPDEEDETSENTVNEFLRHLDITLELDKQSHDDDGRASIAGTDWEASTVLADFITNPDSGIDWRDCNVVELGSGLGKCVIAAGLMGSKVTATDASSTSIHLIRQNVEKYHDLINNPVQVVPLLWGDEPVLQSIPSPDLLIASDVVYYRSNTESLRATIEALSSLKTRVFIAHTWRVHPQEEEDFFHSFEDRGFDVSVVGSHLLPASHQRRDSQGRTPVTIFMLQRSGSRTNQR